MWHLLHMYINSEQGVPNKAIVLERVVSSILWDLKFGKRSNGVMQFLNWPVWKWRRKHLGDFLVMLFHTTKGLAGPAYNHTMCDCCFVQIFTSVPCTLRVWLAGPKVTLQFPRLLVYMCIHTYHVRNNYITYIVAMQPYFSRLWKFRRLLSCVAAMSSLPQLRLRDGYREAQAA